MFCTSIGVHNKPSPLLINHYNKVYFDNRDKFSSSIGSSNWQIRGQDLDKPANTRSLIDASVFPTVYILYVVLVWGVLYCICLCFLDLFVLILNVRVNSYGHVGMVSSPNQTISRASLTKLVHILSLVTDNNPSWTSGRRRMAIEIISWSISMKVWDRAEIKLTIPGFAVGLTTDCATWSDSQTNMHEIKEKKIFI